MSNFVETQHPRVANGQFTDKVNTAPGQQLDAPPVDERPRASSTSAYVQRGVLAHLRLQVLEAERLAARDLAIAHLREQFPWASKLQVTFDYSKVRVVDQMHIIGEDGQVLTTNGHWLVDQNNEPVAGRTNAEYAGLQEAHGCVKSLGSDTVRLLEREGQISQDHVLFSLDLSKPAPDVNRIGELLDDGLPEGISAALAHRQIANDVKYGGLGDLGISGYEAAELVRGTDPDLVDDLKERLTDQGIDLDEAIVETAAYERFRESVTAHVSHQFNEASHAALDELADKYL